MDKKIRMEFLHSTKQESKSAPFLTWAAIFFALVVSGCADVRMPEWMTGEPDYQHLEKQRAIPRSTQDASSSNNAASRAESLEWPNLSQVPASAGVLTPPHDHRETIDAMLNDKNEGVKLRKVLQDDERITDEVNKQITTPPLEN